MYSPPITVHHRKGDLFAVPAIHFCHVFATEVNRTCFNPATQPQAIAVELGPQAAAAVRNHIQGLEAGSGNGKAFPVMLALIKRNRMIRASLKEKAFRLQRQTGMDLSEFSPETLHRELGFVDHSILYLSPVDSIIEAIRCSLQLGVPLYGIDLEEMANGVYKHAVIQDPQSIKDGMTAYLESNIGMADASRDSEIDSRREIAMAARLQTLMRRYSRVLFTGGLAHWQKISQMLEDESIKPAPVFDEQNEAMEDFKRIIVHPSIAVQYMDLFPAVAQAYERRRITEGKAARVWTGPLHSRTLFRSSLRKAYSSYFSNPSAADLKNRNADLESLPGFEAYLHALQQLNHRAVPDLPMVIQAARDIMSESFVNTLTETFMKFPWADPDSHPDCPVLMPPADEIEEPGCAMLVNDNPGSKKRIYLKSIPDFRPPSGGRRIVYRWDAAMNSSLTWTRYTWRPWEYLISSMSYQALQAIRKKQPVHKTTLFEGNILDGIDMKSTLRDFSRGKDRFYVRDRAFEDARLSASPVEGFPVMFILSPGPHPGNEWKVLVEPMEYMKRHVRNAEQWQAIRETRGDQMIASIGYGYSQSMGSGGAHDRNYGIDHYHGILVFQPICWTNRQFARWAELTRYKSNPIYGREGGDLFSENRLKKFYEQKFGIMIGEHDWTSSMALIALPFCGDCLTVVMPEGFRLEPIVYDQAQKQGVKVAANRLEMYLPEQISRVAKCQMVPAVSTEPEPVYSKSIERAIGESQNQNRELVPSEWLQFGAGK